MDNTIHPPATFAFNKYGSRQLSVKASRSLCCGLAVFLEDVEDGEPYATASMRVPGLRLADDEFVFKTYSENDGLLEAMIAAGIVETTGRFIGVGMAGDQPICRLLKE
jgi:hypothetical protein